MANSVNNDSSDFLGRAVSQPPIVLARLPRVGEAPQTAEEPPAVSQPMPQPETIPQLDLRTEIDQRTRLHIANTPDVNTSATTSHFVDRHHQVDRQPNTQFEQTVAAQPELAPRIDIAEPPISSRLDSQRAQRPKTLNERLFDIHSVLAPHAGLIVAVALITAAGMLYWMIVGPAHVPVPDQPNFSHEFEMEGVGATSSQMPDDYEPEFAAQLPRPADQLSTTEISAAESSVTEMPLAAETAADDDLWTEVPLPKALPQTNQPESTELTASENELQYPSTSHSKPLDFSKLKPASQSSLAESPQPLPPIARRPTESSQR